MSNSFSSPSDRKLTIKTNSTCQVCGDSASIINYGALTCLSCRTFFRRNGFDTKKMPVCRYDGDCEVTTLTRKVCAPCRLAKCLAVGMSPDLIRKEDLSVTKRKSTTIDNREIVESPPKITTGEQSPFDHLSSNLDLHLNNSDWNIISKVVHAFDTFNQVKNIKSIVSSARLSITTVENDSTKSIEILKLISNSLQSYIRSTPDFKVLTYSEQISLFQRNLLGLLSIGGLYLLNESGILDKPENEKFILPLYGHEFVQRIKIICLKFNYDPILIKLLLILLAFSSNCYVKYDNRNVNTDSLLFGTFRLFGSQTVYVELLWKYLLNRYTYSESVHHLSEIMKEYLQTIKIMIDTYENNQLYRGFIDQIVEQTQTIDTDKLVPLWGKF